MNILFNHICVYILIILILIYYFIKHVIKFMNNNEKDNKKAFVSILNIYYLKNKNFGYFIILIYLFFTCFAFLLIRYQYIGLSSNLYKFTEINFVNILIFCIIILSLHYYLKIFNTLFYNYFMKFHFYYFHKKFYVIINDTIRNTFKCSNNFFGNLELFFYKLTLNKKDFFYNYKKSLQDQQEFLTDNLQKKKWYYIYILWLLCRKNNFFKTLASISMKIFSILRRNSSAFLYYVPYSVLIIVLFYDLCHNQFYYFYYFLFVFYIINIIKKIRKFYYVKDPFLDHLISQCFYSSNGGKYEEFLKRINSKEEINLMEFTFVYPNAKKVLGFHNYIINYIQNDFHADYILEKERVYADQYVFNKHKMIHIIILGCLLGMYNILFWNKYLIYLFKFQPFNLFYIIIIILSIFIFIYVKIFFQEINLKNIIEVHNYYKKIFYIFFFVILGPVLYMIIINKIILYPNEIIFEINNVLKILETFTIEEKEEYLEVYLELKKRIIKKTNEEWIIIAQKIKENIIISDNINLMDIRNAIDNIIMQNFKEESINKKVSLLEKTKDIWEYIKQLW